MARKLVGVVTSDVRDKTITVEVSRSVTHPVYGKRYSVTKKFAVHDEKNQAHIGDKVEMVETRPISKTKTWKLARVVEAGHATVELKDEAAELMAKEEAERAAKEAKEAKEAKAAKPADKEEPKAVAKEEA